MMLDKSIGKILLLKYLLCYRHVSILITLKQLKMDVQKKKSENYHFDHFTLFS